MASNVSTLNSSVPTNWIAALHHDGSAPKRRPGAASPGAARAPAANVKKIDPRRRSTASAPGADELHDARERAR